MLVGPARFHADDRQCRWPDDQRLRHLYVQIPSNDLIDPDLSEYINRVTLDAENFHLARHLPAFHQLIPGARCRALSDGGATIRP